ncbi:nucleoside/nucleotide kinase family protein [Leptolyngbya ectocarpi]|uniref:hypothetical protein n=1 Tax=Leptolyngbya ectocarpi TaxID=1202 RepID=UPI0018830A85|nr:hypothetical protein [Leptolyngbya ectocarpi]
MLTCIQKLVETLNDQGIRYCHWKSNFYLQAALAGEGDLDLLVERQQAQMFESLVADLGFKRVIEPVQASCPSIWHFYGLDQTTGQLVHLHVYYRLITGESLLKNYSFPLEGLLLSETESVDGMPIPSAASELVVCVLRMMLKHGNLAEALLLWRSNENFQAELTQLFQNCSEADYTRILTEYFPTVEPQLFNQCLVCLCQERSWWHRWRLADRLKRQLHPFNRLGVAQTGRLRFQIFAQKLLGRLWKLGKSKYLASGGAVIAFVGPEATGKSTLVQSTTQWLGQAFQVRTVHLGKPPATGLNYLPNLALPWLRRVASGHRKSVVDSKLRQAKLAKGKAGDDAGPTVPKSWLYALRAVLVAQDRYRLACKIRRQAVNGRLVICDRYPSTIIGAMDSPRLDLIEGTSWKIRVFNRLTRLEHRIYGQIPPPDLVVQLTVPLKIALQRNRDRQKFENEAYVSQRHQQAIVPLYPHTLAISLDTGQSQFDTIQAAHRIVWGAL